MGLASALSTALTGLSAAETTIDVVGNNLANSNTVGFKASQASFATQFLQTLSLGSAPTSDTGGTNPRQLGLGTMVADITPNFNQGTVEISANPMDMAIQGDGFFMVQGDAGEQLYTRNGLFKLNSENQIVTITGNRLLGYGVNDQYELQNTLEAIQIPLGGDVVTEATENAYLEGTLSPTGDVADTAEILQTGVLGDATYSAPTTAATATVSQSPDWQGVGTTGTAQSLGGPALAPGGGDFLYRFVFAGGAVGDPWATEGKWPSIDMTVAVAGTDDRVQLDTLPPDAEGTYSHLRIYRTEAGGTNFYYVDELDITGGGPFSYTDQTTDAALVGQPQFDDSTISGQYSYYVTFVRPGAEESRPSPLIGPRNVEDGRIHLTDIPTVAPGDTSGWTHRRIYRNTNGDPDTFYMVAEINDTTTADLSFSDNVTDADIVAGGQVLELDGPTIQSHTELLNVLSRDGDTFQQVFEEGTLRFTGRKGGRTLQTQEFEITDTTTVGDLIEFMEQALGIQASDADPVNPIQQDDPPGGIVTTDGRIQLTGNNGEANAIDIGLSGMQLVLDNGTTETVGMPFGSTQSAEGSGASTDFLVYDSLGIPLRVRLSTVLESRDGTSTTYRWFAESPDNDPATGYEIGVGTGQITFDGEGNFVSSTNSTVSIDRRNVPSASPLSFDLDFSALSGLAADENLLAVGRQDGSAPGVLTSFLIGEDGSIRGVYSNGVSRTLGQIQLARFANPAGLEQKGENLYAEGINSGLPIPGSPGQQGIGTIIAGAVELSNTDIGGNLIDLILASTMYRGNTRVITTAQQMIDELLALRR